MPVPRRHLLPVAGLLLATVSGCARSATATGAAPVVLNVPPPPPRVISVPPEPVPPVETTTTPAPPAERRPSRPTRPAVRPDQAQRPNPAPAETEPAPGDASATPATAEPPAAPAPVLRTPQTADESQAARRVREVLGRASALLSQVIPAGLSREARTQHETARRFVEQAEQALLERNFVFASYLADKAETLARGLSR